jgi:hypothetical protein
VAFGSFDRVLSGRIGTMPTFLNKVFVGRLNGNVEEYNASTGRLCSYNSRAIFGKWFSDSQHQLYVPLRLPMQMDRF